MKKQSNIQSIIDLGKMPPSAIDLEEIVLGSCLLEPNSINEICNILKPESFYKDVHQKIYAAILEVKEAKQPIDMMIVSNRLKRNGFLDEVGGTYFLAQLTNNVASTANLVFHAFIIHEKYLKRTIIQNANNLLNLAYDDSVDIDDLSIELNNTNEAYLSEINKNYGNLVQESRVTMEDNIKQEPHFIAIKEDGKLIGIMSKNSLSVISGKAKARKSFALALFSGHISGGICSEYIWCKPQKIAYFDTEQARYYTQKILNRICHIVECDNTPSTFELYNVKRLSVEERMLCIETVVKNSKPDVVVIDGIRDLVYDFNDLRESSKIVNWIMKLNDVYNCHVSCVLHLNKADNNVRGHLGAELLNKCESALNVYVDEHDKTVSLIEARETRNEGFQTLKMRIVAGVPEIFGQEDNTFDAKVERKKQDRPF